MPSHVATGKEKFSALVFVFLMLSMSLSSSISSWEFQDSSHSALVASSGTNVTLVQGFYESISTNISGGQTGGSYEYDAGLSGLSFTSSAISPTEESISAGQKHMCVIMAGALYCSGDNTYGQLGIGTTVNQETPQKVEFEGGLQVKSVSAGYHHTCAILENGHVNCWGRNIYGTLGNGNQIDKTTPQSVDLGTGRTAISIDSAWYHTCAILDNYDLRCWGYNYQGSLGIGTTTSVFKNSSQPVFVGTGRTVVDVSAGGYHTCAVLDDGSLKCWGYNYYGQLGIGNTNHQGSPQSVNLGNGVSAASVSSGQRSTCVVLTDGAMKCWGENSRGQLGIGSTTSNSESSPKSVILPSGFNATSVSVGYYSACALLTNNSSSGNSAAYCWGRNGFGELGIGESTSQKNTPTKVLHDAADESIVIMASEHSTTSPNCLISKTNKIYCWGYWYEYGAPRLYQPVQMPYEMRPAKQIEAGSGTTCVINEQHRLECIGLNTNGQLGNGNTTNSQSLVTPRGFKEVNVSIISQKNDHSCAILQNGSLYCWGSNSYGQLGIGNTTSMTVPVFVNVGVGKTVTDVSVGSDSTCAILNDGSLKCWGRNLYGELGTQQVTGTSASTPQSVNLGSGRTAVSVSASTRSFCAILDNGALKCWGLNNYGQLGIGNTNNQNSPQTVTFATGRTAVNISMGQDHACAILDNGSINCWGDHNNGQLGIGSGSSTSSPTYVDLGSGNTAASLSSGSYHTCAVLDDASVVCWGRNDAGKLGIGSPVSSSRPTPQSVSFQNSPDVFSVSAGNSHTCATTSAGQFCWGDQSYNTMALFSSGSQISPTKTPFGILAPVPYQSPVVSNDSWYGKPDSIGTYPLNVYYNTSLSSTQHSLTLNVVSPLQYQSTNLSFEINQSISAQVPTMRGGPYQISVSPSLPSGLALDANNGTITGTPTQIISPQTFSILVVNYSGQAEINITIGVVDVAPDITASLSSSHLVQGFRMNVINISNTGGNPTSLVDSEDMLGLRGEPSGSGKAIVGDDQRLCFTTTTGVYCANDQSSMSHLTTSYANDISITSDNVCMVVNFSLDCQTSSHSFSTVERTSVIDVGSSDSNICILTSLGSTICSGSNYSSNENIASLLETFATLESSRDGMCAATLNGDVYCWGDQSAPKGQVNPTTSWTPSKVDLGGASSSISLSMSEGHACSVLDSFSAACWGLGMSGQLGYGSTSNSSYPQIVSTPNWVEFTSISTGGEHTCAMNSLGGVMCWGNNAYGQLGDGTTTNRTTPVNVTNIPSWMNVVEVHAVYDGTCVVDDTGGVWCWGNNANGKLGLNASLNVATTPSPVRFPVSSALRMTHNVNAHIFGAPLVNQTATNHRWYANNSGGSDDVNISISVGVAAVYSQHLFNLTRNTSNVNVQPTITGGPYQFTIVPGLPAGMSIGASNGTIWGMPTQPHALTNHTIFVENNSGYDQVKIVLQVHDIAPTIVYPSSSYSLVRNWTLEPIIPSHQDGHVDRVLVSTTLPVGTDLMGIDSVSGSLSTGENHVCAIVGDLVKCRGMNNYGALGLGYGGSNYIFANFQNVVNLGTSSKPIQIDSAGDSTCVLMDDGQLKCWGKKIGFSGHNGGTPTTANFGSGIQISHFELGTAGGTHVVFGCAVTTNGSVLCWGDNGYGQLGDGTTTDRTNPVYVDLGNGTSSPKKVSLGYGYACVLMFDGTVKCWGKNQDGSLGQGTTQSQYTTPQSMDFGTGRTALDISSHHYHSCVLLDNFSVSCWGSNQYNQISTSSQNKFLSPQIIDSTNVNQTKTPLQVITGRGTTCVYYDDTSIECFGDSSILPNSSISGPQSIIAGNSSTFSFIELGYRIACAITLIGDYYCWGVQRYKVLGNTTSDSNLPLKIESISGLPIQAGAIYGKPTITTAGANYTFTANNTYGSSNDTVWIEVVPAYDYGNNTLVLTRNQSFSRSPVITGGPYNASFSPALPLGLSFNVSNGTIWGMPTHLTSTNTFILHVSNSTGSDSISLKIYIDDIPPEIVYSPKNYTFVRNWEIDQIVPTINNGTAGLVSVSPSLPSGLNLAKTGGNFALSQASFYRTCTYFDAELWCWGLSGNSDGSPKDLTSNLPANFQPVDISLGHSQGGPCFTLQNKSLYCIGWWQYFSSNSNGFFVQIPNGTGVVASSQGFDRLCVILENGRVNCAGRNNYAQLGIGNKSSVHGFYEPLLPNNLKAIAIDSSGSRTCVLMENGEIYCWGGQNNNAVETPWKVNFSMTSTPHSLHYSRNVLCVQYVNSSLDCTSNSFSSNLSDTVLDVSVGDYSSCVLYLVNGLVCGSTKYLQNETVVGLVDGNNHEAFCAYLANGSLMCMGDNTYGQVGDGTKIDRSDFVFVSTLGQANPSVIGMIYGIPTSKISGNYTLTANNTFGSSNDTISIEVLPAYDYGNETIWLTRNQTMMPRSPIITGGPYTATIWPPVPSGLFWNASNGTFWGTPDMNQSWTEYYINVSNSTGRDTIIVKIGIGDIVPYVTYTNTTMTYIRGFAIDDELPTHLGGHITTVETYPALPEGLSISDPSTWTSSRPNGTIHGIPTELAAATVYQIWFNNSIGSYVVNLTIDVIPSYDYGNGSISLTRNETMTARSPIITGGPYTTVQLNGTLPPGLFFNAANGTVWGTPSTVVSTTQFIVYIANAWGEDEIPFNITVAEIPPILEYNLAVMSYRRGFLSEHPYPILTGGEVATFEISNSLPPGLMFNDSNGFISGVPTTVWNASVFTVWANNSLGSSSWNLTIEVLAGITHSSTNVVYVRNQTIQAYEPTINIVERNLSITPPLPPGLMFNLQNGTITGSSLIPWTPLEHSIHLWNATGEDWLNVTITVQEILPDVRYDSSLTEALNQFGIVPLLPNGTGGTPVEWSADFKGLEGLYILHNATETTLSGFGNTLCMISSDEEVLCWGANDMGQLGQGHATATTGVQSVLLTSHGTPRDIDVGTTHVCVVLSSGQIDCWGQNDQGQLGQDFVCVYGSFSDGCNGNFAVPQSGQAVNPTSGNFTQVSVGKAHTCALHENGQVYCWGDNSDGQLGLGTSQSVSVPTLVNTMLRFTSIDTGDAHTCGIDEQGDVWCWGRNAFGQLGDSTTISRNLPAKVQLPQGYSAKSISVGAEHSCAILNESQPACWGRNSQGQLGDGTILGKIAPRIVLGSAMGQIVSIEAGPAQTCVVNASAAVWCWGASTSGAFLSNSGNALSPISVETPFGLSIHNIAVGEGQLCSISSRSSLLCRGTNQQGQLLGETVQQRSNFSEWFVETVALSHHPAGTVYGRPSNGTGTYILQLNVSNIVGTHSFNHSIQVMDALSFGLSRIEMIRNTTTSPIQPSTSTYALGTFYIEPSLPSGLMFNSMTGEISGRPDVNMTLTSYAMIFANEFGHDERMFDLIIYEPAADVVYPGLDIQMTRGESNLDWIPVVSNGSVETWSIVPNLPDGLMFENGALTGTPIVNSSSTVYRIYANNTGGVTFVDLNITVVEPRPVLLVGSNEYIFTRQSAISAIVIANTGGFVERWSIEPDLPEGLTFIDGVLSGTPSVNMTLTTFTVSAQNSGGTFVRNINITVLEPVPILESSATDVVFVRGEPITNVEIINDGGMVANWTISPSLPDGLSFENGVLFGTPEVNSTLQIYTIVALNSGGQTTFALEVEVVEPLPEFIYTQEAFVLSRNTPFEGIVPVSSGGHIASWSISPSLPSGLFFDERRGVIQGLAVSTSPSLEYTVVAENSGGQTIGYFTLEVRNPAPSFTLPSNELAIVEGQEMNRFTPFVASGDVVDSWELSIEGAESLPAGLVFDLTTGALSGRPAKGATILELTITATNDGGSSYASLNLSILADFDGDGIADMNDEDDDNDGYSDIEEQAKNSDPMDSTSTPVEGFEIIIPNTEISLGAWDIIGMLTGIPLIIWLTFSLVTRNKRTQSFVDDMKNAKTREELDAVAERYEKAIMWKLIGPHHGMRLERLRAEADDAIEERERAFKYKLEESEKEEKARQEITAEFYDEIDQTPLVEKAEEGKSSEQNEDEELGDATEAKEDEGSDDIADDENTPDPSEPATSVDDKGYEWLVVDAETSFYRVAGSSDPWIKFEN